jgi:hypothetical protein
MEVSSRNHCMVAETTVTSTIVADLNQQHTATQQHSNTATQQHSNPQ